MMYVVNELIMVECEWGIVVPENPPWILVNTFELYMELGLFDIALFKSNQFLNIEVVE